MNAETIKLIIDIISPILVVVITAGLTSASVSSKNNKSIDAEQYQKVFAPIHKILNFENPPVNKFMYYDIKEIISANYAILPANIILSFNSIKAENFDKYDEKFIKFKDYIDTGFNYLSSSLGYSREKVSISDKKKAKKIINSESFAHYSTRIITRIMIVSIILSFYFNLYLSHNGITEFISSTAKTILSLFTVLTTMFSFYLGIIKNIEPNTEITLLTIDYKKRNEKRKKKELKREYKRKKRTEKRRKKENEKSSLS